MIGTPNFVWFNGQWHPRKTCADCYHRGYTNVHWIDKEYCRRSPSLDLDLIHERGYCASWKYAGAPLKSRK